MPVTRRHRHPAGIVPPVGTHHGKGQYPRMPGKKAGCNPGQPTLRGGDQVAIVIPWPIFRRSLLGPERDGDVTMVGPVHDLHGERGDEEGPGPAKPGISTQAEHNRFLPQVSYLERACDQEGKNRGDDSSPRESDLALSSHPGGEEVYSRRNDEEEQDYLKGIWLFHTRARSR